MKHLQENITPPSEYAPDLYPALEKIILKCTPEERGKTLPECRRTDPGFEEGVGRSEWRICRYGSDPEYGRYGDDLAGADGTYEKASGRWL